MFFHKNIISVIILFIFIGMTSTLGFCKTKDKTTSSSKAKVSKVSVTKSEDLAYEQYIQFFEKVYKTMEDNYFQPISREAYDKFIQKFKTKIYSQLKGEGKSDNFVKWRSAAFLVDDLKDSKDIFSALYPPKPAKQYEQTALGQRIDLGLEGHVENGVFVLSQVEPRSDAYDKGLRINDHVVSIDGKFLKDLAEDKIQDLLNPLINTTVKVSYSSADNLVKEVSLTSKEYFKQTVFLRPVPFPGVFCLEIQKFNRTTGEDLLRYLDFLLKNEKIKGLILDLRGNPGGPPLAAREISSFFLPNGDQFAYFEKKGQPKSALDVPTIPEKYKFHGPLVIFVNKESGSASELFTGILQHKNRATVMGINSAGQVFLKSMFPLGDESMLLLVTGRGHHPDGSVFSFDGITPDKYIPADDTKTLISYAAKYINYVNDKESAAR